MILGFRVQGSVVLCRECQSARVSFSDPQLRLLSGACGAVLEGQNLGMFFSCDPIRTPQLVKVRWAQCEFRV